MVTCEGVDGEGLMGLNNMHLKLKANGTATSQRNSMANTSDKERKTEMILFFYDLTSMGE